MLNHIMNYIICKKKFKILFKFFFLINKWMFETFENTFIWKEQLVARNRKFYKINLWKKIKILIFKAFDVV